MSNRFIHNLKLTNLLSFGPDTEALELQPLNVFIGPNGSGKSNFLDAISLLKAAPVNLSSPVKESGGVKEWLWKGSSSPTAKIEATVQNKVNPTTRLRHILMFGENRQRFEVTSERIESSGLNQDPVTPNQFYINEAGRVRLFDETQPDEESQSIGREMIDPEFSILSQFKDPRRYASLSRLSEHYNHIRLYRDWSFGRDAPPRQPQPANMSSSYLTEDCKNLPLVLNAILPLTKDKIISFLKKLIPDADHLYVQIFGGWVQLCLVEGDFLFPATRLSDGALRYLCLLAILLHPDPPPLVCIEEPELGLHPDILPTIARLLVKASERMQLVVTTHSDILVDALSDAPESIVVCEKVNGQTRMKRLKRAELKRWLDTYKLGELWIHGAFAGKRR